MAQLVEHIVHIDGVTGSSPVSTTTNARKHCVCGRFFYVTGNFLATFIFSLSIMLRSLCIGRSSSLRWSSHAAFSVERKSATLRRGRCVQAGVGRTGRLRRHRKATTQNYAGNQCAVSTEIMLLGSAPSGLCSIVPPISISSRAIRLKILRCPDVDKWVAPPFADITYPSICRRLFKKTLRGSNIGMSRMGSPVLTSRVLPVLKSTFRRTGISFLDKSTFARVHPGTSPIRMPV